MTVRSDVDLAMRARPGDEQAAAELLGRYEWFLATLCRRFFLPSSSADDLRQEARVALLKAWRDYDPEGGLSFRNFVKLVVDRHLIAIVIGARRLKHELLTGAVRVGENEDGETLSVVELAEDPRADIVQLLADREDIETLLRVVNSELSPLERATLIGFANGKSHAEIFEQIGRPSTSRTPDGRQRPKTSENARDRGLAKIRRALEVDRRPLGAAA